MKEKRVEVFTINKETVYGFTGDYIEFHRINSPLLKSVHNKTTDEKMYVETSSSRIQEIVECDEVFNEETGQFETLRNTLYFAVDPELEKYLSAKHKAEVESLQHRIDGLKKGNSELYKTVTDFVTKFYKLEENIDNASLWSRIKYVFTGKIK